MKNVLMEKKIVDGKAVTAVLGGRGGYAEDV